jgi:hypothetical protein
MGGAARDDFDEALVVEVAKAADDVTVERLEVGEGLREVGMPVAGELGVLHFAHGAEVRFVFAGCNNFALNVFGELGFEDRVSELLEEDGGEV